MPEQQTGAQTQTPAGSAGAAGVFDNLALPPEAAAAPETKPGTPAAGAAPGAEGQPAASQGEQPPAAAAQPPKMFAGRFPTPEALETAYNESSKEGRRLYALLKEADAFRETLETQLSDLKTQSELGSFKELTKEELQKLAEENPLAAQEYIADKKLRERELVRFKTEKEKAGKEQALSRKGMEDHIMMRSQQMESDAQNFPDYSNLMPLMEEIMDRAPELTGHRWTPELLYFASYGYRALQAGLKARQASAQDTEEARKKAEADALRAGSSGPTATGSAPAGGGGDTDEAFNARLVSKAPKPVFQL